LVANKGFKGSLAREWLDRVPSGADDHLISIKIAAKEAAVLLQSGGEFNFLRKSSGDSQSSVQRRSGKANS
jgi:hypothetical protein